MPDKKAIWNQQSNISFTGVARREIADTGLIYYDPKATLTTSEYGG